MCLFVPGDTLHEFLIVATVSIYKYLDKAKKFSSPNYLHSSENDIFLSKRQPLFFSLPFSYNRCLFATSSSASFCGVLFGTEELPFLLPPCIAGVKF
jgi:hypothetical protein